MPLFKAVVQIVFCKTSGALLFLHSHPLLTQNWFLWARIWPLERGRSHKKQDWQTSSVMFLPAQICVAAKRYRMTRHDVKSWPFPSHAFMKTSQGFNMTVLTDSLTTGNSRCHSNTLEIDKNDQHGLELWKTRVTFFLLGEFGDSTCTVVWFLGHT